MPLLLIAGLGGLGVGAFTTSRDITNLAMNYDQMSNQEFAWNAGQTGVNTAALLAGGLGVRKGLSGGAGEEFGGMGGRGPNLNSNTPIRLNTVAAEFENQKAITAGREPPWLNNTNMITEQVPICSRYNMVIDAEQIAKMNRGEDWQGGWGTPEPIPSQQYMRNNLVILDKFKSDVSFAVTVETTGPQIVNRGYVGPLNNYEGMAQQVQFVGPRNFTLVGPIRNLPIGGR